MYLTICSWTGLVCGTSAKAIQRRLFAEPVLMFEKVLETALAAEAAEKDSKHLTGTTNTPDPDPSVNKLIPPRRSYDSSNGGNKPLPT